MGKKKNKNNGEGEKQDKNNSEGEKQDENNSEGEKQNDDQQQKNNHDSNGNGDGGKKKDGVLTVVLKVDMHCDGCETRIKKCVRAFKGVEYVKGGDGDSNKLTVIGNVDPVKLRQMVEKKTMKKVELVSPLPPKKDKNKDKDGGGGGGEKKTGDKPEKKTDDHQKPKEIPVATAVMKLNLHCQGCIQKLRKAVTKTKGYHDMSIDEQKNLVTVKGAIDMKALAESLKEKLKKPVEIVPPKKDGEKKEKGKGGGGGKAENGRDGGGNGGDQAEVNKVQYVQYGFPQYIDGYGLGYPVEQFHAPQMFSDENPNACSVM